MAETTSRGLRGLQDRLLVLLGNTPTRRPDLVASMLRRDASEATSYWLQLVVSVGIATLGLVVGSTAVVIGAMLVAPLMGPIVGLAMGLATGSPFLVLRSIGRIGLSVVLAVGGAAGTTLLLPFHEINAEIAARTSPTLLDLITAGFCALAGVYATLKAGSDTATTAAGTSISISLVPPLCVSGFGVGIHTWPVAGGAALLFLTNLVAIVVVGSVAFVSAGFNRVDVVALEAEELQKDVQEAPIARALARRLSVLFATSWGSVFRLLMPFVLLAAVYVPLRRALDEVAWQVRVRTLVQHLIEAESLRVVQSRIRVERHEVDVALVVLGTSAEADLERERLDTEIQRSAGVVPRLDVLAVPDSNALAGLQSSLLNARSDESPTIVRPTPQHEMSTTLSFMRGAFDEVWPHDAAGDALAVDVGTTAEGPLPIRVVHLGEPIGSSATETLQRVLGAKFERQVRLVDVAVPAAELSPGKAPLAFLANVAGAIEATSRFTSVSVCVTLPPPPKEPKTAEERAALDLMAALTPLLSKHPNVTTTSGDAWSVQLRTTPCPAPKAAPPEPTVDGVEPAPAQK